MGFNVFDPLTSPLTSLLQGFLAADSGMSVDSSSISLHVSGAGAVSLYDAAAGTPLGIGPGVLLTSGITPGTSNTSTWYGADNSGSGTFYNGDADIDAVVNTVFQTQSYDATTLAFSFSLTDPAATSISFDLVFGSDEYPEWVDAFVDCAVVIVDGVNYALFNNDPLHPLSVISPNLAAGYFQDNGGKTIPIEYDGVSSRLRIVAPLKAGQSSHTIKIGIADTGDHILDSGLFIADMRAGTDPGSGVVSDPGGGSSGDDNCTGSSKDEYFDLQAGDDTVYAGGGADIIVAGAGNDLVCAGSGDDDLKGDGGDDRLDGGADLDTAVYSGSSGSYTITYDSLNGSYSLTGGSQGEGTDTLLGVEQLQFSDGLFSLSASGTSGVLTAVPGISNPSTNSTGLVMLSGLVAVGSTLTATVADVDGLSAAGITWQWYSELGAIDGATSSTYKLQSGDSGHNIWVEATYTDAKGQSEAPSSGSVFVQPLSSDGELTATLMQIEGPASASVHTPITTLLLRAVELGESPWSAIQKIRTSLGVPAAVGSLLSTNAFQILESGSGDTATALKLAKLEVQVAVICSVSDDPNGLKLALALLSKGAGGEAFDLTNAADVASILGLDPSGIDFDDKDTWPKTLLEIIDRTNNLQDADGLHGDTNSIDSEWQDFLSNWDDLADTAPLSDLSLAINQGPTGFASAALTFEAGTQASFALTAAQLLQGFSDPDGDTLTVSDLTTDRGAWFTPQPDGSWTLDPSTYDPDYRGPLELTYTIDDGNGHSLSATQLLLVVDHLNHTPSGTVTIGGSATQGQLLSASDTLADLDGLGPVTYTWLADGVAISGATGGSLSLTQAQVGRAISVRASYVDGFGKTETVSSTATAPVANIDDEASGTLLISGAAEEGGSLSAGLSDLSDPDGPISSVSFQWQQKVGSSWIDLNGETSSSLPIASDQSDVGRELRVVVTSHDGLGGATSFISAGQSVANVNDAPSGGVSISGVASEGQTLTADISSLADADGLGVISFTWLADDVVIAGSGGSSLLLGQAQVGKVIRVIASWSDGFGQPESVSSAATAAVAATDLIAPTLAAVSLNGTVITLSFSETIAATGLPPISAFKVQTISGGTATTRTITSVVPDPADPTGRRLLLNMSGTAPAASVNLRVTYTDPSSADQSTGVVQDLAGHDLASVTQDATTLVSASSVTSLASSYRELILSGSATTGTGNSNDNRISGNAAANTLIGGTGNDTLIGGAGSDTYGVDSSGDSITELAGGGIDTVQSSVSFSLAAIAEVEHLSLTGSAASNAGGNGLNNQLSGNGATNALSGGDGQDTLIGGAGGDTLTGGGGNDVFRLTSLSQSLLSGYDRITDFAIGNDSIDGPSAVTAANLRENVGTVSALSQAAIQAVLTTSSFARNGAATFTYGSGASQQIFLALNDGTAGFSAGSDAILEITGYTGSLSSLQVA